MKGGLGREYVIHAFPTHRQLQSLTISAPMPVKEQHSKKL